MPRVRALRTLAPSGDSPQTTPPDVRDGESDRQRESTDEHEPSPPLGRTVNLDEIHAPKTHQDGKTAELLASTVSRRIPISVRAS